MSAQGPAAAPEPAVSILVVNYNTREMTLACLASVARETRAPHEVIVVDNASADGSAAAIAAAFPDMRLIASDRNLGFARANNIAAREARAPFILLLNPDTLVLDGAIDRLLAFAERRPEAGIWGGRTLDGDGALNPTSAYGDTSLWGLFCRATGLTTLLPRSTLFNPELYGGWARDSERAVDVVQGSFFLIRRAMWEQLGGFDLSFVMYGEEQDLCRRARAQAGARPRMTPDATIVHYHGASSKRVDREILTFKAKATLIRRHFPRWQQPLGLALLGFWPWSRKVSGGAIARLTGQPGYAEAATRWGAVWAARAEWLPGYPILPPGERA